MIDPFIKNPAIQITYGPKFKDGPILTVVGIYCRRLPGGKIFESGEISWSLELVKSMILPADKKKLEKSFQKIKQFMTTNDLKIGEK